MASFQLAQRCSAIDSSGIRRVFDLAKSMKDPINLSIGQPDFDVPEAIKNASIAAIQDGQNGYTPTQGLAELRAQVQQEEAAHRQYADDEVLITSGVSGGLFLALMALVEEGTEVLIPDPYFVMYKHLVACFGGTPVFIDTYETGFVCEPEAIEKLITAKTKVLLLNSPANPTGRVLDAERLQAIAKICEKHGVMIISDEIYRAFSYVDCPSISAYTPQCLTLGGWSKTYGMTGWRLGFACGPAEIVQAMARLQQYSFVCAPAPAQYAALACPQVDMAQSLAAYEQKRDLMVSLLSECFDVASADGAFYLWFAAPQGESASAFVERAIAANVLLIPGSVFSERDTHLRVCYTVSDEKLKAGAEVLLSLAQ